jgi:cytochrome c oxidase cbb3-type subunit 3
MNKLYLWGIIFTAAMLGFTYVSVMGSEGGLNGDIVNMLAVAGAVALVIITVFVVIKYVRQMQTDTATGELADESWDNIGEYKNPVPMGWAIMFLGTMIWGMWYFIVGYPVNAYSQIGEYNEDTKAHNEKFNAEYANITGDRLVEMGESVFLAECKVCHGIAADGIDGKAANLNQRLEVAVVKHAILNGANNFKTDYPGGMPAGMASGDDVDVLANYIANGMKGEKPAAWAACASCHGENGEGMAYVAPKLNGFDIATVSTVLKDGKKGAIGKMPAFDRLNEKQIEAVGAYITSLSK